MVNITFSMIGQTILKMHITRVCEFGSLEALLKECYDLTTIKFPFLFHMQTDEISFNISVVYL